MNRPGDGPRPVFRLPWRSRRQIEADLDEEIAFHRQMRLADLVARGLSEAEARARVDGEMGDVDDARRAIVADDRRTEAMGERRHAAQQLAQELWHAVRRVRRERSFAIMGIATLALGLGACMLMFNVVSAVLLAPLPYGNAARVLMVWQYVPSLDLGSREQPLGGREFTLMRTSVRSFAAVTGFRARALDLGNGADVERVDGIEATGEFFDVLGVRPQLGRFFTRADETPQGDRPVVISDGLWRRRFGADPTIVGRIISLNTQPFVVAAVAPPGFAFPRGPEMPATFAFPPRADAWIPIAPPLRGPDDMAVAARLTPSATMNATRAELEGVRAAMLQIYPGGKGFFGTLAVPLRTQLVGQSKPLVLSLLAAVALLLVIACVNAAQLQLAQLQRRRRDLAVRAALGAPVWRTLFGSVLDVLIVSALAGAIGTAVAALGFRALRSELADTFPLIAGARFDPWTAAVAIAATLVVGLAAGLGPALVSARVPLIETLRRAGRGLGGGANAERVRRGLIVVELTLAVVLVAMAALLAKSLSQQLRAELGFSAPHGLTFEVTLPLNRYPEKQGPTYMEHPSGAAFVAAALDRMRAIPGVDVAAMGKPLPLSGSQEWSVFSAEGLPQPSSGTLRGADYTFASDDMFRALGTPMLAGRDFNATDREDGLPVVIVNRSMAKWLWPGQDAVGKRIKLGGLTSGAPWMTVVGVAADLKRYALTDTTRPEMIVPYTQKPYPSFGSLSFVVRSRQPAAELVPAIQHAVAQIDPSIPVSHARTIDDLIADASSHARFASRWMTAFGVAALLLAMIGLYGVIAYSVLQRRQEFGVRRALGASTGQIIQLVFREASTLGAIGASIGVVVALAGGVAMRSLLYGVGAYDVPTLLGAVGVIGLSAIVACIAPAWRASRVEPRTALEEF